MNIELTKEQEEKLKRINNLPKFITNAINKQIEILEVQKYAENKPEDFLNEAWKDIPGYEGFYQASNLGRIKSLDRNIIKLDPRTKKDCVFTRRGKFFRLNYHHSQYLITRLSKNGRIKNFGVHRLIALTFINNPKNHPIVNHKNGIRTDNRVENLEWMNNTENVQHAIDSGLTKICSGENHGSCIYKDEDILKIRKLYSEGHKQADIGKMMNIPRARIWEIVKRKTWKHI